MCDRPPGSLASDVRSVLVSPAFLVGVSLLIGAMALITPLDGGLDMVWLLPLTYVVSGVIGPPKPFLAGCMLGFVNAALIVASWLIEWPKFSLLGETPEPMGYQILVILMIVAVVVGTLITGVVGRVSQAMRAR
jgi:hypothetical protein